MKMKDIPFRFFFIVIISIFIFSCLIWLFYQIENSVLQTLWAYGICLGAGWIMVLIGMVSSAVNERKSRIYQAQEPQRLKQHQARFYCHICGKPSPKPYEYWDSYGENGQEWYSSYVTDYNKPTELVQCAKCQKWTCPSADPPHFENGVCKKCSENPPEQV